MPLYELKALLVTVIVSPVYSGHRDPFLKAKANMMSLELEDICFICPTHQFSFSWTLNIDISTFIFEEKLFVVSTHERQERNQHALNALTVWTYEYCFKTDSNKCEPIITL